MPVRNVRRKSGVSMQEQPPSELPVKILLVDDDPDFTKVFQISLQEEKRTSFLIETREDLETLKE